MMVTSGALARRRLCDHVSCVADANTGKRVKHIRYSHRTLGLPPVTVVHEPSQTIPHEERHQAPANLRMQKGVTQAISDPVPIPSTHARPSLPRPRGAPGIGRTPNSSRRRELTCVAISTFVRLSSLIGPSRSRNTFRIVKFVVCATSPDRSSNSSCTSPSAEKTRSTSVASAVGRLSLNSAREGCRSCVSGSYLHTGPRGVSVAEFGNGSCSPWGI